MLLPRVIEQRMNEKAAYLALFQGLKYTTTAKPTFCVALVRVAKSKILTLTECTTAPFKRATCLLLPRVIEQRMNEKAAHLNNLKVQFDCLS